jgi:hypothetical protein
MRRTQRCLQALGQRGVGVGQSPGQPLAGAEPLAPTAEDQFGDLAARRIDHEGQLERADAPTAEVLGEVVQEPPAERELCGRDRRWAPGQQLSCAPLQGRRGVVSSHGDARRGDVEHDRTAPADLLRDAGLPAVAVSHEGLDRGVRGVKPHPRRRSSSANDNQVEIRRRSTTWAGRRRRQHGGLRIGKARVDDGPGKRLGVHPAIRRP